MRAVLQRVTSAEVAVEDRPIARIGPGLLILLGIAPGDGPDERAWLAAKIAGLRIFERDGRMDASLLDVGGEALVVSQFTLYADCLKGRRPSFTKAAPPDVAEPAYEAFCEALRAHGVPVATGTFGAAMQVSLCNDGPVTLVVDTE